MGQDGVAWIAHNLPPRLRAGDVLTAWVELENQGTRAWTPGAFRLAIAADGAEAVRMDLPHAVEPGARAAAHWVFRVAGTPGAHELAFRLMPPDGEPSAPWTVRFEAVKSPAGETRRSRD